MNRVEEQCHQFITRSLGHGHLLSLADLYEEFEDLSVEHREIINNWYQNIIEINCIKSFIKEDINEVHFHSHQKVIIYTFQEIKEVFIDNLNQDDFQLALEIMSLKYEQKWNTLNPFISFTHKMNNLILRNTLVHQSINSQAKSKLFIRILRDNHFQLEDFQLNFEQQNFFLQLLKKKSNIIFAGSTGSGKTSFLRSLISHIDPMEHVCILEDSHEIYCDSPYFSHLLQNDEQSLKDYCAYVLRMSPQRLILGEIRSSEITPFILAMNSGHQGLLSTIHANSCEDTLHRLTLLFNLFSESKALSYELTLKLICRNVDYVVYLKDKKIEQVIKVHNSEDSHIYFDEIELFKPESTFCNSVFLA